MVSNEFVFDILSGLVRKIIDLLFILVVLLEVVVELANDLVGEVLSMSSLCVLMHDIHGVWWLSDLNTVWNLEGHIILIILDIH